MCILPLTAMIASDLNFELTDLNDLCYHAFLASEYFLEMIKRKEGRKEEADYHP